MPSVLTELCQNLQANTEKLEEELKRNIVNCHKLLIDKKATEVKLALERAKDYHYKEVLDILKSIVNSIRLIILHEEKISKLNDEDNFSPQELKRYSYVQRQVKAFSNDGEEIISRRERRRVASEISVESLEVWEQYLEKKEEEEKNIQVEKAPIQKRKSSNNRKNKKFVSSTFNNFLDSKCESVVLDSIGEGRQLDLNGRLTAENDQDYLQELNDKSMDRYQSSNYLSSIYESESEDENYKEKCYKNGNLKPNLSTSDILESLNREYFFGGAEGDSKPKIVEIIYKKKD